MAVIFTQEIIDSFSSQEREFFDNLAKRGKAVQEKVDVQAMIARRNAISQADEDYRKQLEAGFL